MSPKTRRRPRRAPGGTAPPGSDRSLLLCAAAIALLTLVTFAPVRHFDFVHYDDFQFVVENPHVTSGLSLANLRWAVEHPYDATGGPVTWASHMTDVELFGLDAGPHHVTNLVIHTAAALLLLAALRAATGSLARSAVVAALFAVHPLHVESVAWIAQRKDVLSGVFWCAAIWAYVAYVRQPGPWRYAGVAGLFVLGLLSKPIVASLPFVLVLMDVWPLQRLAPDAALWPQFRRLAVEKLPLVALGIGALALTFVTQRELGAVAALDVVPFTERAANAMTAYAAYIGKAFWPAGLVPFYSYRPSSGLAVAAAVALLAGLTAGAFALARRAPYVLVGWLWFLGTLLPVIGLVQVGAHAMADRHTYLSLIGLFIAVTWAAAAFLRRIGMPDRGILAVAVVVITACAVTARAQTWHWRDGLALWEHTIRVEPSNARAHSNLGAVLAERGRTREAIAAYEESLRLQPGVPQTLYNLGLALESAGRTEAAKSRYAEALDRDPDYLKPRMRLAGLLADAGQTDRAIEHYQHAVRSHPEEPLARVNLAVGLGMRGRPAEALPHMMEAIRLEPGSAQWRYFAAIMMVEAGRPQEAIAMLKAALAIDPGHADARDALATLTRSGG